MGHLGEQKPLMGPAVTPLQVIQALRWLGEITPDEIVEAIQRGGDSERDRWPELSKAEADEMRRLAGEMTKSRLRSWKGSERNSAEPTWLEVRALISGLHEVIE